MERYTGHVQEVLAQQIVDHEDVKGNLVRICIDGDECVVLVFDDGQWASLAICFDYDDHGIELSKDPPSIYALWTAKLLTVQEYAEQLDHDKKYRAKQQELSDKKQLRQLQAKYGK